MLHTLLSILAHCLFQFIHVSLFLITYLFSYIIIIITFMRERNRENAFQASPILCLELDKRLNTRTWAQIKSGEVNWLSQPGALPGFFIIWNSGCNMSSMQSVACLTVFTPVIYFSKGQADIWIQEFKYFLNACMNEWMNERMNTLNSQWIGMSSLPFVFSKNLKFHQLLAIFMVWVKIKRMV